VTALYVKIDEALGKDRRPRARRMLGLFTAGIALAVACRAACLAGPSTGNRRRRPQFGDYSSPALQA
jgi:hypothetical protein